MTAGVLSGLYALLGLLVLLGLGVPVAWSMALVAGVGMYMTAGWTFTFTTFQTLPIATLTNYTLVVIPMFLLMGAFSHRAGIIEQLYEAANRFTSQLKGNLLVATVLSSAGFAAASGSTLASASVFTKLALPPMLKHGYSPGFSAACIAASGTLAGLIPPSVIMIIVASLTNQSAGVLLVAGILPGVLTAAVYIVGIKFVLVAKPDWAPAVQVRYSWREKMGSLKGVWAVILLGALIMGGIYTGAFSPSAAGAVGAAGALLIGMGMRKIGPRAISESLASSALSTARIFIIIIAGLLLSRFLMISGFIGDVERFVSSLGIGPFELIAFMIVLFLVLGVFVDSLSLMVITLPFLFPIATSIGIHPVWFSVFAVKLVEIAAITPPVGLNLFAVLGATKSVRSGALFKGVIPFIVMEIVVLALIIAIPGIIIWLPDNM